MFGTDAIAVNSASNGPVQQTNSGKASGETVEPQKQDTPEASQEPTREQAEAQGDADVASTEPSGGQDTNNAD